MRKALKITGYIIGGIFLLLILLIVIIQTPWGENQVRKQAVSYLSEKLSTEVAIGKLKYALPNHIELQDIYLSDSKKDTLLFLHQLKLDLNVWTLLSKKVTVNNLLIDGLNANIYRKAHDTTFNYQFIIDAFVSADTDEINPKAPTKNSSASGFTFDVHKITLDHIRLRYDDTAAGLFFSINLGQLLLRPTLIDINKNNFALKEIDLSSLSTHFFFDTSYLAPSPPDTTNPTGFKIAVENIHLKDINYSMLNRIDSMYLSASVGKLEGAIKQFDLLKELIQAGNLSMENSNTVLILGKENKNIIQSSSQIAAALDTSTNNWRISADQLTLNQIGIVLNDPNKPRQKSGIDYYHLNFKQLFLNASDAFYSSDSTSADLKHLALLEQSGLNLMDLRTKATYTNQKAILDNLYLQTPNSLLQDYLAIHYPSLDAISNDLNKLQVNIQLKNSKVGINDLLIFVPSNEQKQLLPYKNQQFNLVADAKGYMNQFKLNRFYLSGLDGTTLDINGILKDLGTPDKLSYTLNLKKVETTEKDLSPFLPDSLKQTFRIPDKIAITGKVSGTTLDYYPDLKIKTSDGNADINGKVLLSSGKNKALYDLNLHTQKLNLGKILKQDSVMGFMTTTIKAKGIGFDPKSMQSQTLIQVQSAQLMGYDYQNITLTGTIKDQKAAILGKSTDPNLNFNLSGMANFQNEYPIVKLDLKLNNANLGALKLTEDTISLSGNISANFQSLNPDYPVGSLYWTHPSINFRGKKISPDSLYIISKADKDSGQNIEINLGNLITAVAKGHIPLSKIGEAFESHINRHYHLSDSLSSPNIPQAYDFALNGKIQYQGFLKRLVPDLSPFDSITFNAGLNNDSLSFSLKTPKINYGDNVLDSTVVSIHEDKNSLKYHVALKKAQVSAVSLWYPYIGGIIRNDSVYAVVNIDDSTKKKLFTLGGAYFKGQDKDSSTSYFKLFKGIRFNYDIWSINADNIIAFTPEGFYISNLKIAHDNQYIDISSEQPRANTPIHFKFNAFSLANFTKMFSGDTLLADGTLMGDVALTMKEKEGLANIDGELNIWDLHVYGQPVGNLNLKAHNTDDNTLFASLDLKNENNNLNLIGSYFLKPENGNNFDFNLKINPLELKTIQSFTFGAIKNSSGSLNGQLNIKGTIKKPIITGQLNTNQSATTVSLLNAYFKMPSESITFKPGKISFNNFHIEDRDGNLGTLSGEASTTNFLEYFLNLKFSANHWHVLHSKKKDNPEYYGDLILSTKMNINGAATAPDIEGNLTIEDSTDLHYALLDTGPGLTASEGIVKFVDSRDTFAIKKEDTREEDNQKFRFSPSTQLNVNVEVKKGATFTILIDPTNGDELQLEGEATLNAYIDQSGDLGLTGTYKIQSGYYELNYKFLHRKFDLKEGSVVTLSGNPLDATADITGVYNTDIAPYDLVQGIVPVDQLVYFKQRLPFQVLLKLNGKVMKPEISFDIALSKDKVISLPGNDVDLVQAKLNETRNNPSELNKQVFAVLILNKFLSDNPFTLGNGSGVEHAARKSVSRFLSDQINQMTSQLIKGFKLDFDLSSTEDYTTGSKQEQTSLNISASKSLFNDRLNVTVGNNFMVEGERATHEQSSLIPGNISLDYILTKDGRYKVSVYRSNDLQNIIDGYVVETGLKLGLTLSYNKFKYLFVNRKKYWKKQHSKRAAKKAQETDNNKSSDDEKEKDLNDK